MQAVCINSGCRYWRGTVCDKKGYCIWKKGDPQPLDPATYGYWNAYMVPLREHADTHYLEIVLDKSRLLVRLKGDFVQVNEGEGWHFLEAEDYDALETLLQECKVRFVKIGEVKQEMFDHEAKTSMGL